MAAQRRTLAHLLARARDTRFGREHGFAGLSDVAAYQRRVTLRSFEAFRDDYFADFPVLRDVAWPGLVRAYANTSGTSGAPTKRIPVSRAMMRSNRAAAWDVLAWHLAAHPHSRILGRPSVLLGGTTAADTLAPGIVAADLSGLVPNAVPAWLRRRLLPPPDISRIGDWREKMARLAPLALQQPIASISGAASWMALFFETMAALRPGARLPTLLPDLELLIHGGVGFAPYRERFAQWIDGGDIQTREVYAASEGFVAMADRGDDQGLRLVLDRGLFFEFVRVADLDSANPDRRWIADAELGVEYALVLSSNAGLWSYVIGDTVMLVSKAPARIKITGRTSWMLSVAGEHVIGAELDAAVTEAAAALGRRVIEYAAAPIQPDPSDPRGGHLYVIELDAPCDTEALGRGIDAALTRLNEDYAAHRGRGFGLRDPHIRLVPHGAFDRWMESRGKLGGQNKVPRVARDSATLDAIC